MTPTDVSELLEHLFAAYPHARMVDETPLVWMQHLERTERIDAQAAAWGWIEEEKFMPSVAQFLERCRAEARHSRELDNPTPRTMVPAELEPVAAAVRGSFVDAVRAGLAVSMRGGSGDEAAAAFTACAPDVYPERVTYPCRCGEGRGWVTEVSGAVSPCPVCRPEMYDLWLGGHLSSGHRCRECRTSA